MAEPVRVLVIGAGMAGLFTALALAREDRQIELLERDPPSPEGDADQAFQDWDRRGVGHLRHSHAFLARLREIVAAEHPGLLAELRAAGCREFGFEEGLPSPLRPAYVPAADDETLAVLMSRRTTLELVIRRHVEHLPGVRLRSNVTVLGLLSGRDSANRLVARGLRLRDADGDHDEAADLVVDAAGRTSPMVDWLAEAGAQVQEESEDSGILYYTRHWRLRPGVGEPERGQVPGAGDLGFLKYGVFPGDNGCFSVTLAVPEIETELRKAVVRPQTFDALCALLPGVAAWTDPDRSEAVSKVFGMGDLKSRWRNLAPTGEPLALNLFCVGDSLVRTNPLYGRGCTFAAIEAHLLRDVLADSADPVERARRYQDKVASTLFPYFDDMRNQDRQAIRRARRTLDPGYRPKLKARLLKGFVEDGVTIAIRSDVGLYRSAMRAFHMLDPPGAWLKRPAAMTKVLAAWARGRRRNAAFYPPKLGPERTEMLTAAGLDPEADRYSLANGGA